MELVTKSGKRIVNVVFQPVAFTSHGCTLNTFPIKGNIVLNKKKILYNVWKINGRIDIFKGKGYDIDIEKCSIPKAWITRYKELSKQEKKGHI